VLTEAADAERLQAARAIWEAVVGGVTVWPERASRPSLVAVNAGVLRLSHQTEPGST
jgi:hypothetical protein